MVVLEQKSTGVSGRKDDDGRRFMVLMAASWISVAGELGGSG
jgi:hypothetical protein